MKSPTNRKMVCNATEEELLEEVERRLENLTEIVKNDLENKLEELRNTIDAIEEAQYTLDTI